MSTRTFFSRYIKKTFFIMLGLFAGLIVMSYFLFKMEMDSAVKIMEDFAKMVSEKGIMNEEGEISVVALFMNNFKATAMAAVLGFIPFVFLPLLVVVSNAVTMGAVFAVVIEGQKESLMYIMMGIIPHGIFEIPAVILGVTLGVTICLFICQKVIGKGKLSRLKAGEFFLKTANIFGAVVIPLLIAAAIVETYITPAVMNLFG